MQRKLAFAYKVFVPICSGFFAILAKLQFLDTAFWVAIVLSATSTLKAVVNNLILPESKIEELDRLTEFFGNHQNKLETIFYRLDNDDTYSECNALDDLKKQSAKNASNKTILSSLILWIPRWIDNDITKESERHLREIHFNKYDDE